MTDKEFKIVFPYLLKAKMAANGFRQHELAERAGISEVSLSRYLRGHRIPNARELHKITEALGCGANELLNVSRSEIDRIIRIQTSKSYRLDNYTRI